MRTYSALFEPDLKAGGFVVTFPDVPGCITQGDSLAAASEMAVDALETMLDYMISQGGALPAPRARRGKNMRQVSLSPLKSAKVELYAAFAALGKALDIQVRDAA